MNRLPTRIAFLACLVPLNALAATEGGFHAIRGAGLLDCETYLSEQEKESPAYLMIGGWIDGYITGVNQYAAGTFDVTSFESTELFAELIKNHCRNNPGDRLFPVVNSIIAQRWNSRITERTPHVRVGQGTVSVQLYRETIVRIQERLSEKGFFTASVTGQYDADTISALAAFQETLDGYEATGYPDQATLWALFVE